MAQIINMFLVVAIFWLVIEIITDRIHSCRKSVKLADDYNDDK